jgi:hypothetical protein
MSKIKIAATRYYQEDGLRLYSGLFSFTGQKQCRVGCSTANEKCATPRGQT